MKVKFYIAGRVSGLPRADVIKNFIRGEKKLAARDMDSVNPLSLVNENMTTREIMKILLPAMLDCDGVLLLSDWKWSEGARIEHALARYSGLKVIEEDELI